MAGHLRRLALLVLLAAINQASTAILPSDIAARLVEKYHQKVYDARSKVRRQVDGVVSGSVDVKKLPPGIINAIVLTDSADSDYCLEQACYFGNLSVFGDLHMHPTDVEFDALSILLNESRVILLDVRNRSELIDPGKIPGSVNVPLHEIPQAFELDQDTFREKYQFDMPEKDASNIVLTCRSGRRILAARERLIPLGYNSLRLYRGSFKDWKRKGGTIE